MPRRKKDDARQASFAWADRKTILENAPAGEVIFEAPELRPASPRRARSSPPRSLGLPFGVHDDAGTSVCWSCGKPVDESTAVRAGPGDHRCPSCGAKLPFV